MKRKEFLLFSILSLFLFSCAPAPAQEIQIVQTEQRTISVTGTGEIKVSPDVAEIIFGAYTFDKEVNIAKQVNEEISQKVLEVLKDYDIAPMDIKTDYLGIIAETTDTSIYRYGVRNAIKVTIHDLTELDSIIIDVLNVGGVRVEEVNFRISELDRYRQQARDLAIQSAKEEARSMVVQFGQEIDLPVLIHETPLYPSTGSDSTRFSSPLFEERMDYYPYNSGSVSFRQVTISSTINVTYSLKPQ